MNEAWQLIGSPEPGGILVVADHASNHVPAGIDLGLTVKQLSGHIAWDIGVAPVATLIAADPQFSAVLGGASRLLADLNRRADEKATIPTESDGITIAGNQLDAAGRAQRLQRFHHPYHEKIAELIRDTKPAMLLSLHSFTPNLQNTPDEARPWEIGIMYNEDDRAARIALPLLEKTGLTVGDQKPYSGKLLNATMNLHGEATATPYLSVEMRQDMVAGQHGQERYAAIIRETCHKITEELGVAAQNQ